jgi:hypothetical protein
MKLALDTKIADPHRLNDIIDPVFSDNVQVHGIKHRYNTGVSSEFSAKTFF